VPVTLEDLAKPEYKDMLVMENPATSSPGLAFLLATIKHFGANGYLDYWKSLRANGVVVVDGWETAYYTNFSGSSGHGPQPLVVSYASDPAAEVVNATTPLTDSPVGSMLGSGTCFRQIEFVGILKGTRQLAWPGNSWISCWASSSRRICRCRCTFTRSIHRQTPGCFC
jgi:thiamine transport system substrate-binding protein